MPQRDGMSWLILRIEDKLDELTELNEFFTLYHEGLDFLYRLNLEELGVRLNLNRLHILIESHESLYRKLLVELGERVREARVLDCSADLAGVKKQ